MADGDVRVTESLLRRHVERGGVPDRDTWVLGPSPLGGRGVFATRDLHPGELVLEDVPLALGPRAGAQRPPLCLGCHASGAALYGCSRGCGLPVCSEQCETSASHLTECRYLQRWRNTQVGGGAWSPALVRTVAALRCLNLDPEQRCLVRHLQTHSGPQHEREVDLLKAELGKASGPNCEDEEFLRVCCRAMDANAFEVEVRDARGGPSSSLRGLYPLGGMLNHGCTPNTRHGYTRHHHMVVTAAVFVPRGAELTTSYTAMLWGTSARRHNLAATKHFLCTCTRCRDPQEGGTRLSALRCAQEGCPGSMLPCEPLTPRTKWVCDGCALRMPDNQARVIQASLGQMVSGSPRDPDQTVRFLREQTFLPASNQLIVEMKTSLIWSLGHREGFLYADLTEEYLEMKINLCREIMQLLVLLQAGQCRLKGLLLCELYETLKEKSMRLNHNAKVEVEEEEESHRVIEEAAQIFLGDVTSPLCQGHMVNGA